MVMIKMSIFVVKFRGKILGRPIGNLTMENMDLSCGHGQKLGQIFNKSWSPYPHPPSKFYYRNDGFKSIAPRCYHFLDKLINELPFRIWIKINSDQQKCVLPCGIVDIQTRRGGILHSDFSCRQCGENAG